MTDHVQTVIEVLPEPSFVDPLLEILLVAEMGTSTRVLGAADRRKVFCVTSAAYQAVKAGRRFTRDRAAARHFEQSAYGMGAGERPLCKLEQFAREGFPMPPQLITMNGMSFRELFRDRPRHQFLPVPLPRIRTFTGSAILLITA